MDNFTLSNDDTEAKANFISLDPQFRKCFCVPEDAVPELMKLLQVCYKEGVLNHLHEIQDTMEHCASGLVFEFKFVSKQSKIEFETVVPGFIRVLFKEILPKWIAFSKENEDHFAMYLSSPKPDYDHSTLKYKSTFRIIIPSIMLHPDVRFFIYQRVWHSVDLKKLFEKKLNYRIRDCLVRSARTAPLPLIGSCGPNETTFLFLDSVRKIVVESGDCDGESTTVSSLETKIPYFINESSINHPCEGGIVEKGYYCPTEACLLRLENELKDEKLQFQLAYDEAKATFVFRTILDHEIQIINDTIALLSDTRFNTIDAWLDVIRALASEGNRYYTVAVMVTKDRAKCRDETDKIKDFVTWTQFQSHYGGGCHAINTPIRMFDGSIKMVQDVNVGDKLMGDDNTPRLVQKLFRGNDEMFRICPINGETFEVNKDHVLSLKFTNVCSVQKRTNGAYRAVWFELNGEDEPKKRSQTFTTEQKAAAHLEHQLSTNKKLIKKGDIIDIKIKSLMQWCPWWLKKVALYRSSGVHYAAKKLSVDPYAVGYWLTKHATMRIPEIYKRFQADLLKHLQSARRRMLA